MPAAPARGEIWWAHLPAPAGSGPGYRRPVLVVSADSFNLSALNTVIGVAVSSNIDLAESPGNVELVGAYTGLRQDSVANVTQVLTIDKARLDDRVGGVDAATMRRVEAGLRLVLELAA
ncbi:MAG: type II toxin-antitoxin system PemK/MazF family toxin [Acidimicrobiaceae bacterium]|nr:type II toxin-antitoxin system PemK/MazF family toxin [Acidimicrobiaceae bacterium]